MVNDLLGHWYQNFTNPISITDHNTNTFANNIHNTKLE